MMAVSFDTLVYSKILRDAGLNEALAEALTRAQNLALNQMLESSKVATKGDIAKLETRIAEMDARIAEMDARIEKRLSGMDVRIAEMEARIEKRLSGMDVRMAETDARIAEMEARLLKAFSNYLFGFAGIIVAALAVAVAILK